MVIAAFVAINTRDVSSPQEFAVPDYRSSHLEVSQATQLLQQQQQQQLRRRPSLLSEFHPGSDRWGVQGVSANLLWGYLRTRRVDSSTEADAGVCFRFANISLPSAAAWGMLRDDQCASSL